MKKLFDMKDELNARLTILAREKGMTKTGMLNLVVEKGIAYYEKKRFMNPTQEPYYSQEQPKPQPQPEQTPIQPQKEKEDPLDILASL